ncbi:MAG: autotransporter outer membrane beta-barrel domain-containing protein, partial [Synergistaceae bacterium]|nr:autotransporter outer membrane beta-barrel domain-containing protein [Synergistaceae bacterium]
RGGYTTGYNFIIDTSVRTDPDDPESETATDQYLVARLPDVSVEPDQPPAPGPDNPDNPDPVPITPVTPPDPDSLPDPDQPSDPDIPNDPDDPNDPHWAPDVPGPMPKPTPANNDDPPAAHETTALTNGRLAGLAFIGARGAWLADHSYESANIVLSDDLLSGDGYYKRMSAPFAGIDGAWLRVDNDHSHVDIDAMNAIVGFASRERKKGEDGHPDSSLLWAAFIDLGYGDYDTYNNYNYLDDAVIDDIHGDGSLRSYGIGLMARKEWANGFRLEGSLRGGKLKNEFTARDYLVSDVPLSYTVDAPYYGLHLGVGRTFKLDDPRDRLDLLLRYYWNRQEGESVVLPGGTERVDFQNDDSHRARLGMRFSRATSARRSWYIGAAVEHEFAGDIHAWASSSAGRFKLPAPDLEGTTGIGEIGFILRPDKARDHNFSLETGIQGYIGKYEGFSAGIRLEWEF